MNFLQKEQEYLDAQNRAEDLDETFEKYFFENLDLSCEEIKSLSKN